MGDNNTPFPGHPFYVALSIFNAVVRTPLNIAAAFWRPWFTDDGNKKMQTPQAAEGREVEISLPKTEDQLAAIAQSAAKEVSHPTKRKHKALKPPMKRAAAEKKPKPKAPTKHTLKEKLELEREEQAHKTDRLRKLRQAKEAAEGRKRSPNNGHGGRRSH